MDIKVYRTLNVTSQLVQKTWCRCSKQKTTLLKYKKVHGIANAIARYVFDKFVENGYGYVPNNIDAERLLQCSCDNIDVPKAKVDSKSDSNTHS